MDLNQCTDLKILFKSTFYSTHLHNRMLCLSSCVYDKITKFTKVFCAQKGGWASISKTKIFPSTELLFFQKSLFKFSYVEKNDFANVFPIYLTCPLLYHYKEQK